MALTGPMYENLKPKEVTGSVQKNVVDRCAYAAIAACDRSPALIKGEKGLRIRFCRNFDNMLKETKGEIGRDLLALYNKNNNVKETEKGKVWKLLQKTLASPAKADPEVINIIKSLGVLDMTHILGKKKAEGMGVVAGLRLLVDSFNDIKDQKIREAFINLYASVILARYSQSLGASEGIMDMMNQASHVKLFCKTSKTTELVNSAIDKLVGKREGLKERVAFYGSDIASIKGRQMLLSAMMANRGMCEYSEKPATAAVGTEFACKRFDDMLDEVPLDFGLDALHAYACYRMGKAPTAPPYDPNKLSAESKKILSYFVNIFKDPRSIDPKDEEYKYIKYLGNVIVADMHYVLYSGKGADSFDGAYLNGTGIVAIQRTIHDLWKDAWKTNDPDPKYFLDRPAALYVMRLYLLALVVRYRMLLAEIQRVFEIVGLESSVNVGKFKMGTLMRALDPLDHEIKRLEKEGLDLVEGFEKAEALRAQKLAAIQSQMAASGKRPATAAA